MFYVGVDLGKKRDPATVAIVEKQEPGRAWMAPVYKELLLRHLERVPLSCELTAVTITGGERERYDGHGWNVPKQNLISAKYLPAHSKNEQGRRNSGGSAKSGHP